MLYGWLTSGQKIKKKEEEKEGCYRLCTNKNKMNNTFQKQKGPQGTRIFVSTSPGNDVILVGALLKYKTRTQSFQGHLNKNQNKQKREDVIEKLRTKGPIIGTGI